MSEIKIEQHACGDISANCYFIINEANKEMLIVDPGGSEQMLAERIRQQDLKPQAILLTHGHFDHTMAAKALANVFHVKIYAHEQEEEILSDAAANLSGMLGRSEQYPVDVLVKDNEVLQLAGISVKVIHTPGHTPGGCCYYLEKEGLLLSGDTLFQQSVGRTDFPQGSMHQLIRSIREKLLILPEHTRVYPGHMDMTTIGQEKQLNPFL